MYYFELPEDLIANYPTTQRDKSKLLVLQNGQLKSLFFHDIIDFFQKGDVLVLNDSKVIKSRIIIDGKIEFFLHKKLNKELDDQNIFNDDNTWLAFAKPSKKIKVNDVFDIVGNKLIVVEKLKRGEWVVSLELKTSTIDFFNQFGQIPLPPYIKREAEAIDENRYQTVYAKQGFSVAAPTAGLHFTDDLLDKIRVKGVEVVYVTLHVGAGTFLPIQVDNIDEHKMHYEAYSICKNTADVINEAKKSNAHIFACGTTTIRALESSCSNGLVKEIDNAQTNLFIKPGFNFQVVDRLITNFHLPKSTLLLLVAAFAGEENIKKIYTHAIENKFRFFSYGDASLIFRNNQNE